MIAQSDFLALKQQLADQGVKLAAVSKTHGVDKIREVYDWGQRIFAENKAQEITEKQSLLPDDIEWHFVGHLQTNKVKYIIPFISLIHAVDRLKLLKAINKEAQKQGRLVDCLLQIHIARDETKYGMDFEEAREMLNADQFYQFDHVRIRGLMGIATLTEDREQIKTEFQGLRDFFDEIKNRWFADAAHFNELSMGMTGDYDLAIEKGSTIVRVGSYIFGERDYG